MHLVLDKVVQNLDGIVRYRCYICGSLFTIQPSSPITEAEHHG